MTFCRLNHNITAEGGVANNQPATNTASGKNKNEYRDNELDSIPPTRALFDLIKSGSITPDQKYKYIKMIDYVYTLMQGNKWKIAGVDTGGNFRHKVVTDPNDNWNKYQIALDGLYMAQPFFMELANALDDPSEPLSSSTALSSLNSSLIYEDIYNRMMWIDANFYNSIDKLYNHGWGSTRGVNGQYWLRAIGWYAAALADVITMMPEDYSTWRNDLIGVAEKMFEGMMGYQDSTTGMWRNVVNKGQTVVSTENPSIRSNENYLESSGTALIAYSMLKLYDEGLVGETYGKARLKAFNGTVVNELKYTVTGTSYLDRVYISSGVLTDPYRYLTNGYAANEAKGVGPLMMAACYANSVAVKLQKADPQITAPEANTLTYNGTGQELVTSGSVTGGTLYYALGEDASAPPTDEEFSGNDNTEPVSGENTGLCGRHPSPKEQMPVPTTSGTR